MTILASIFAAWLVQLCIAWCYYPWTLGRIERDAFTGRTIARRFVTPDRLFTPWPWPDYEEALFVRWLWWEFSFYRWERVSDWLKATYF